MDSRLTTREKLLDLLKKETQMTVNQMSQRLNITEMAVRKHLNILDRDSFIQVSEIKQPMGRPVQVFSLTKEAEVLFPKNYENLTVDFLHDLQQLQGDEIIDQLFENRSKRLADKYASYVKNTLSNKEKLETLTNIQSQKGYMAELNQIDTNQFELIEYNCPIFEVSKNFKQACTCETKMFKKILNTKHVQRTSCKADGENHCHFLIHFDEPNENKSLLIQKDTKERSTVM
ncbi:helix-turn-helix transcriptional regulator [Bacillus sp. FSL K6-3431]|uniref:helix-turn-helix transcriptional regulator n=1 Tax=Bacillus sp. FSL K6-3431 TaxID=2921500 RepID=UPI0030FBE169